VFFENTSADAECDLAMTSAAGSLRKPSCWDGSCLSFAKTERVGAINVEIRSAGSGMIKHVDSIQAQLKALAFADPNQLAQRGVVFKPTYGRVSDRGVIPLAWTLDHVGPLCKTVEDAALVLNAIVGYDESDPSSVNIPVIDSTQRTNAPLIPTQAPVANTGRGAAPAGGGGNTTAPFNIYGIPTISIPCGFTSIGLPIGLQISGAHFAESTVIAIAHAYERATDWHLKHPPLPA
jgi:Amidase